MTLTRPVCLQCGGAVEAGARFCANCGADVSAEQGGAATRKFTATQAMHDQLLDRVRRAALGEYEILTELGRGGMATVYLAHDIQLDRKVAIKVMLPSLIEGDDMVERFRLEARTSAQLSHPHIIPIYAVRSAENLVYFVMKFVEGRPLDAIARELRHLPIAMVQSIISRVGDALGYAHRRGVVHRDIKPANLMIDVEGQPVVTDFGIAKVADERGLTMTGVMVGTPTYMSPEQCSAGTITGASDQYSLGVVAYQLLGGKVPFESDSVVGLLYKHCHEEPGPVLEQRPDCPPALAAAVMRMLAKEPADRFPSMEAAVEAIGSVTLSFDDPVRTQLVGLAKRGENVALLKRVSTPMSPTPLGFKKATAPTDAAAPPSATTSRPKVANSRRALAWGGAAVLVLALAWSVLPFGAGAGDGDAGGAQEVGASAAGAARTDGSAGGPAPGGIATDGDAAGAAAASASDRPADGTAADADRLPAATSNPPAVVAVASIRVTGAPASLTVGESVDLRAVALGANGATLTGRTVTWSTEDPALAAVTPAGRLTTRSPGEVTLVARSGGAAQRITLNVLPARAASVAVAPPPAPLSIGASARLDATAFDALGREVETPITWRTSDARIATVTSGLVTAVGAGTAVITAVADGREGRVNVSVAAAEVVAPAEGGRQAAATDAAPIGRPATPPVDDRTAIDAVIQRYARALESKQLSEVRAVYPGMRPEQETQFTQTLRTLEQLRVVLRIGSLGVVGDEATAAISGTYDFYSPENRRTEHLPVNFTATLDRGTNGWQIRSIR